MFDLMDPMDWTQALCSQIRSLRLNALFSWWRSERTEGLEQDFNILTFATHLGNQILNAVRLGF